MKGFERMLCLLCIVACAANVSWGNYGWAVFLGLIAVYYMADAIAEKL